VKKVVTIWRSSLLYCLSSIFFVASAEYFNTTFEKFESKALSGDFEAQNFIGYMSFYGEGTKLDYEAAHYWFHLAAEQGYPKAQRNLGLLHAKVLERIPDKYFDAQESNFWLSKIDGASPLIDFMAPLNAEDIESFNEGEPLGIGERVYRSYCAGCHGFDGMATYHAAPSFAKGDRMDSSDNELLLSIKQGKSIMPAWEHLLSKELREYTLAYIRTRLGNKADSEPLVLTPPSRIENDTATNVDNLGSQTYDKFCAGCHGFSGIAYYVNSPSFALGERMEKSDAELTRSISNGLNIMPGWSYVISHQQIDAAVNHIRTLSLDFDAGIEREINSPSDFYYTFKPNDGR
jgi:mono/diheme cytochrome c family protein